MAPDVTEPAQTYKMDSHRPDKMATARQLTALAIAIAFVSMPLVTPAIADSLVKKMHNISDTLKSDLSGVLDMAVVKYSEPSINTTYISTTVFNMKGMGILYNYTRHVIDVIAQKDAYPAGVMHIRDGNPEPLPLSESWRPLLVHYSGLAAVVLVVALFVVLFPIAGLCWCCCYCAQSRRQQPFDRKHDSCVKGVLALLLICLITLFMFGVVCSFVTDDHIQTSSEELPEAQRRVVADVGAYVNATDAHMHWLLVTNYKELEKKLLGMIDSSGMKVSVQLGEFSRAVSVTTLNKMVQDLDRVRANLVLVKNVTFDLRYNAERLDQGLRKVKGRLLQTLANCSQSQCRKIQEKYKIGELSADIDYSQLPDVTELLEKVNDLINGNIKTEVEDGQRVFNSINKNIEDTVNQHIPVMQTAITDTGKEIENISRQITEMSVRAQRQLKENGAYMVRHTESFIDKYGPYRRYLGIGVCTFILLVLLTLVLGLLCGVCGKRPEGYGNNDCCNKGAGSRCLLTGMVIIFMFGWAVAVIMLGYLLIGVLAQRVVCDPLGHPQGNRLFSDLESIVQLERELFGESLEPQFNMAYVINNCHRNKTVYEVLHLHRVIDLGKLQERVRGELRARIAQVSRDTSFPERNIVILKKSARNKLEQLAQSGLSDFPFDSFTDVLVTNITSIDLTSLAQQLINTAEEISGRPEFVKVTMELRDAAGALNMYQRDIVDHMLKETAELNETAIELRDRLRFNHSSFTTAVEYLLDETASAERFLSTQGPDVIRNLTREFAEGVAGLVHAYLERVVRAVEHDVGRCGPISNVYNATLNATCRKILMPINGFWISLAWCLVLFFPIIIISQKLAKLYTKTDPYPGPLVEAEYMYDAYADRDNIPLANAYLAEKQRGRRSEREGREGRGERGERGGGGGGGGAGAERRVAERGAGGGGGGGTERAAVALEGAPPPLDAHNPRRYNDMAPKHWEEGPPRYHGPTEYERPPPYYYPGPNDRQ